MDYQHYTVADFILDEKFRQWILNPEQTDITYWEEWVSQHPDKAKDVEAARALLLGMADNQDELNIHEQQQLWDDISMQVAEEEASKPLQKIVSLSNTVQSHHIHQKKRFWTNARVSLIAASVLLIIAFGAAYYLAIPTEAPTPVSQMVTKENPWGQRSTIYLSDGTEVTLNAGSSIRYEKEFSSGERAIDLAGEAFFEVAKDSLRPFRVKTGNITTQALGTSFNVKAYEKQNIEVALVTGKVSVKKTQVSAVDELLLSPGEHAVSDTTGNLHKSTFDPRKVLSWKEGVIYFDHANEAYVVETLEHWYGVKINIENTSSKKWNYTASFDKRSLEHVLMSIGFAMDFQYEIKQKNITIKYH